ncbi:hypothetical protein chiPu_0017001 [Chiloscyllium punctatum]|uniref:Uncharacterized protein n=1 Tax=Chiloscyllium punctatum TaxID=137246 RepID=A0A401T7A3_CHIPU|nr:hypothetical protein [Chiloscyllium punctatum]
MGSEISGMGPEISVMGPEISVMGPEISVMGPEISGMGPEISGMGPEISVVAAVPATALPETEPSAWSRASCAPSDAPPDAAAGYWSLGS